MLNFTLCDKPFLICFSYLLIPYHTLPCPLLVQTTSTVLHKWIIGMMQKGSFMHLFFPQYEKISQQSLLSSLNIHFVAVFHLVIWIAAK